MSNDHKIHKTNHVHSRSNSHHADKDDEPVDNSKHSLKYMIIGVGIVVAIIIIAIILSRFVFKNDNVVEYNHYVFQKFENNKWMTQQLIDGQVYNIPFYNNPLQVLDIPVDPNAIISVRKFRATNGTVYITVDPNESSKIVLAGVEYARILGDGYNIYNMNVKSAISNSNNINATGYEVITCNNQSKDVFVIYQKVTNKNLVSVNGNCVLIESINANESIRVADAYAFRLLNIIRE